VGKAAIPGLAEVIRKGERGASMALSDGRLVLRSRVELVCMDVRAAGKAGE
jgi:hypothetical protein